MPLALKRSAGTVGVANAGVEQVTTTGTAGAINLDGVTVGAGGITFDSVTTAATATSNAVDINDASGGVITLTTVNLAGTAITTGLDISGNARTSNVDCIGRHDCQRVFGSMKTGTGTAQIDANISRKMPVLRFKLPTGMVRSGAVTVNGTVTNGSGTTVSCFDPEPILQAIVNFQWQYRNRHRR